MFAYCGNNPINFIDHSGFAAIHNQAYLHIERNKGYDYITDQDDPAIADKHLGLATISHGGCGVIASYNALITLGASRSFDEVLSYYNSHVVNTLGFGLMGLLPYEVAGYFSSLGYSVIITNQKNQIDHLSQTADACIMYYEFPQTYSVFNLFSIDVYGAHFIEYHKVGSGYRGLNTNGRNGMSYFESPSGFGYSSMQYNVVGIFVYG